MDAQADFVLRSALNLGAGDRAEIAASLIASLEAEKAEDLTAAWGDEIRRRIESIDKGEVVLIPSDEVMRSMRERLDG